MLLFMNCLDQAIYESVILGSPRDLVCTLLFKKSMLNLNKLELI